MTSVVGIKPVALITGASSGIGKSLARKFASQGYDLILVSRDQSSLEEVANPLRLKYSTKIQVLAKDLANATAPEEIFESLQGTHVDVLVNNAGFGVHGAFADTDICREEQLVNLQVTSLLKMTKIFIPSMIKRKRGKILNIASVYAFAPVPYQAVYSACKAFMLSFSESLAEEVAVHGIHITVVCPGATKTEFRKRSGIAEKENPSGMDADTVAESAFKAMMKHKNMVVPGPINKIFVGIARHLSGTQVARLMIKINRARGIEGPSS